MAELLKQLIFLFSIFLIIPFHADFLIFSFPTSQMYGIGFPFMLLRCFIL